MQLAIFGRDPKSAVASFLEQQEFQFWQKNPNNQTSLIVLFSRTVLAVSVERTKKVLSGLKMEIIYMGFKSNDYHSLTQKWFHKMSQLHSSPFLVWVWMHCTRTQLQSHPSCLFLPFKAMGIFLQIWMPVSFWTSRNLLGWLNTYTVTFPGFPGKRGGWSKNKRVKKFGTISAREFAALLWDNMSRRSRIKKKIIKKEEKKLIQESRSSTLKEKEKVPDCFLHNINIP